MSFRNTNPSRNRNSALREFARTVSSGRDFNPIREEAHQSSSRRHSSVVKSRTQLKNADHQVINRFYDKNLSVAMDKYRNQLQHTARLMEIKNQTQNSRSSRASLKPQLVQRTQSGSHSRSSNYSQTGLPFDQHSRVVLQFNQATQARTRVLNRFIYKQNEGIFQRLQQIQSVSLFCLRLSRNKHICLRKWPCLEVRITKAKCMGLTLQGAPCTATGRNQKPDVSPKTT